MAATDNTAFPYHAQQFEIGFEFVTASTGAAFSGSLTALAATVSKDRGAFGASTNALTQIGTSAITYLTLTAAEMTASVINILPTCSNSGVVARALEIRPLNMTEPTTSWDTAGQIRLENLIMNICAACINEHKIQGGLSTIFTRASTKMLQGNYTELTGDYADRGAMS